MIDKSYLESRTIEKIKQEFLSEKDFPSVVLFKFLEREAYLKLREQILHLYFKRDSIKTSHSYAIAPLPFAITKLWNQKELIDFLSIIINQKIKRIDAKAYSFASKDYTILCDKTIEEPGIDFIFDFTHDWDERANGYIFYKDEQGNFISLPIAADMLALVQRKAGVQRYVQYVNHHAGNNRRILILGKIEAESL